jgi:hypothetical protein
MKIQNMFDGPRWAVLLLCTSLVIACTGEPIQRNNTNNPDFQVSLLFEHEGIKVYRFRDGGHNVYFTNTCGITKYNTGGKTPKTIESHNGVE